MQQTRDIINKQNSREAERRTAVNWNCSVVRRHKRNSENVDLPTNQCSGVMNRDKRALESRRVRVASCVTCRIVSPEASGQTAPLLQVSSQTSQPVCVRIVAQLSSQSATQSVSQFVVIITAYIVSSTQSSARTAKHRPLLPVVAMLC